MEVHSQSPKRALFRPQDGTIFDNDIANPSTSGTKLAKYHSQPMPAGSALDEAVASGLYPNRPQLPPKIPRIERLKDKRFDSFKTWSGKLERKLSNLRGKRLEVGQDENSAERNVEMETLPVHRYFDALEGPELDTLRVCVFHLQALFCNFVPVIWLCNSFSLQLFRVAYILQFQNLLKQVPFLLLFCL